MTTIPRSHIAATALLLLSALLLSRVSARGDVMRPAPATDGTITGIMVQGHAELKVKPDIARLTIGVTTQASDQAVAAAQDAAKTTALLAALRGAGIADRDIDTSAYDVEPQYNYQASPPVLTGYQVSNTVDVTIHDLAHAGAVIDKATGAGATNVSGLSFDLADRTAAEQQALAMAVTEAKAKAAAMAQAAGVQRGPLLSLSEGTPAVVQPLVVMHGMMAAKAQAPETPIQSNTVTVTADVTAIYAIAQ